MNQRLLHLFYISAIFWFVFGFEYVPAQDYPNLLYQAHIFNQLVFHGNTFGGVFSLYTYVPPNAISTVVIAIFSILSDPFFSGKLYLFFLGVALYFGIYRYLKSFGIQYYSLIASISFYLTFNLHYVAAYLNFVTGLALVLHILATIRNNSKLENNPLFLGAGMLLLYLCHFIALAIFAIYLFINYLVKKKYAMLWKCLIAATPTLLLFGHYLFMRLIPIFRASQEVSSGGLPNILFVQVLNFCRPIIPFHHFKYITKLSDSLLTFELLFSGIILLFCILLLLKCIKRRDFSISFWLSSVSLLLCLFLPSYIGGILLPGERFAVFCLINCIVLYLSHHPAQTRRKIIFVIVFTLGIVGIGYTYYNEYHFNIIIASHTTSPDSLLAHPLKHEGSNGFLHFHYYDDIKFGRIVPFSNTGLIAYPDSLISH